MRAGVKTLRIIEEDGLLANAARGRRFLQAGLERELAGVAGVTEVRGKGLMLGIELDRPCGALLGRALDAGLMINVTAERVVRLLPPLILEPRRGGPARRHPLRRSSRTSSRTGMKPRLQPQQALSCSSATSRAEEYAYLFERAARSSRSASRTTSKYQPLVDRTLAMVFEKASTRTRVTFEAGMYQMGGSSIVT